MRQVMVIHCFLGGDNKPVHLDIDETINLQDEDKIKRTHIKTYQGVFYLNNKNYKGIPRN